jgi:hypothetical protein
MRASLVLVLTLGLTAPPAAGQVPRDPLAGSEPVNGAASAGGGTSGRQLPAPFVTKQSDVEVPFTVRPGSTPESEPTAVRVFVSWDQGKSWHFYDERKPQDGRFRFRPRQDGEFWFATQTIDRAGKPDSPEPRFPQLRLIVDTQRPQLLVQAQVDTGGNVNVGWNATDASLAAATLKIEYQDAAGSGGAWQPVEPQSAASPDVTQAKGQTVFHPAVASRSINLRAEIADAAGNIAYFSQRVSLNPPQASAGGLAQGPAPDQSATRWPASGAPPTTGQPLVPNLTTNPFVGPGRLASAAPSPTSGSSSAVAETLPLPANDRSAEELSPQVAIPSDNLPAPGPALGGGQFQPRVENFLPPPSGFGGPPNETMPAPEPTESVDTPSGQRPRLTNSKRFSLDYDVQSVGPEGLAAVELWGTTDGGRTWIKWGSDPDKTSPFDVEVNHEANYGFRIVIVGKNGLATGSPQAGDAADIWVGIDLTRPTARLIGAEYGQGEAAGKLDIRWQAADANLGTRPITIAIGDRPDGPFTPVAVGLPNTGQYYWEFDPRSPRQIFLRLEVRDDAGNVAIDQLTEPIKVEGLEPKGRIRGFNPGPENARNAFRTPLFR